jgi:threonylcarbamoyladenosine tRNA methylthiotransferase MtaB
MRLADLVRRLLNETSIERLRPVRPEPMDFRRPAGVDGRFRRASPTRARAAQSGSDTVLRRMHRKYRPRHYADRIHKARLMPDCAVGADVATASGETDQEFEESRVHRRPPFTYLYVFRIRTPRHSRG